MPKVVFFICKLHKDKYKNSKIVSEQIKFFHEAMIITAQVHTDFLHIFKWKHSSQHRSFSVGWNHWDCDVCSIICWHHYIHRTTTSASVDITWYPLRFRILWKEKYDFHNFDPTIVHVTLDFHDSADPAQTCKLQLYYLKNCYIYTMVGDLGKFSLCKTAVTQGRRVFSFLLFWVFFLGGAAFIVCCCCCFFFTEWPL